MNEAANLIAARLEETKLAPKVAIVLGSGLGPLVDSIEDAVRFSYADLPGFPPSGVSGHAGELVAGRLSGKPVLVLSGRAHYYEHGNAAAMRPVLETLKSLGIDTLILTNAAGSVREDLAPGSVMLIDDHINYSGLNPLIGEPSDARFVGMTSAYDSGLKQAFEAAALKAGEALPRGVYMWFSGPSFETPAEIRMARVLGADAVGMSTVPEVILARFLGLRIAACSVITNFGAGMTGAELSHQETKDMAPIGGRRLQAILKNLVGEIA
ncbi:purine-nucleoside phosphorylase [Phyllobacterium leguminum]|uniref:Purine nucleoside phosphorylase n=1 Tax=Phyllobacterium leguminum TaxID=314237 RepID=A0A318T161_9HYPH|nr:purine-nucleoside phosphorylase [Phyllobacterium leguminum]PYE87426.1 purine-nucleoside phosphorylase [Phyllobacterium leguminum]